MMSNRDLIRMHLEDFLQEQRVLEENWYTLLGYCLGYYGFIDTDILAVVRELQREGKIE